MSGRSQGIAGMSSGEWALIVAMAVALALFSGCASAPAAPGTVSVAVREAPCKAEVPRPAFPTDTLTGDEDLWTLGTTLWADLKARKAYELQLETALLGCTKASRSP